MTAIERLRALEKAVELVAKATKGPWAFMNEKFDDCLLAFGTDSLECDAPPPWYSCWTSINPDDGRALIAAVNFIREHGSAILATASEQAPIGPDVHREAARIDAVVYGTGFLVDGKHVAPCRVEMIQGRFTSPAQTSEQAPAVIHTSVRCDECSNLMHLKIETSPAQTSEARGSVDIADVRIVIDFIFRHFGQHWNVGPALTDDVVAAVRRVEAAMCQEAGDA